MLSWRDNAVRRQLPNVIGLLFAVLAFGCGDAVGVPTVPVAGRITVDGEPLTGGTATVEFRADKSRGNQTPYTPVGHVNSDGTYTLVTSGKKGAPLGWYVVVVAAYERPKGDKRHNFTPAKNYRLLINRKYGDPKTSGLKIEVVQEPAPGQYDLKLAP
jgi:hypothetical protein